jgi:type II secretory pathway pseudopilin PulG
LTRSLQSAARGLTLIELLVVIIILTTLVGGVIPILSPNNDTRKIRGAARGLQGYITLAQTHAASTGRPHGIAFRESSPGSGVALEVFGLEVSPPFAGFSTESRVEVLLAPASAIGQPAVYSAGTRGRFPQFQGFPLYRLELKLADGFVPPNVATSDPLPPRTFRIGDTINVDGNQFRLVDTAFNVNQVETVGTAPNEVNYLGTSARPASVVEAVWINSSGQVAPQGLKRYLIARQPTNSAAAPFQLPAGIVIDMQGSVAEGSDTYLVANRFPTSVSLYTDRSSASPSVPLQADTVGVMFSPTGAVSSVIFNGNELTGVSRIALLLGRVENGGIDPAVTPYPWQMTNANDKDEVKKKQAEINWLNVDSRILSIATGSGRIVVSETGFVNLSSGSDEDGDGDTIAVDADEQIEAAHAFAHEMTTVGGNL